MQISVGSLEKNAPRPPPPTTPITDIMFPYYNKILLYYFPSLKQTDRVSFIQWSDDSQSVEMPLINNGKIDEKTKTSMATLYLMTTTRNELLQELEKYFYLTPDDVVRSFKSVVDSVRVYARQIRDLNASLSAYRLWRVPEFVWDETLERTDVSSPNLYFEICQMLITSTMWAMNCVSIIFNQKQHFELALDYMKDVQRMWKYFGVMRSALQSHSAVTTSDSHTIELSFPHFYEMISAYIEAKKQEIFIMGMFSKMKSSNDKDDDDDNDKSNVRTPRPPSAALISKLCYFANERYSKASDLFESCFNSKAISHRFIGERFSSYCIEKSQLFNCLGNFYQAFTYDVDVQGGLGVRICCLEVALGMCQKMQSKVHLEWIAQIIKKSMRENEIVYSHTIPKSPPKRLESKTMLGEVEAFI